MPPLAGERWWRQPPKGECIFSSGARLACFPTGESPVVKVLYKTGAFHQLKGAHFHPLNPLNLFEPERRRRLNPQARQGLSIRRVNLREYWKAPPRSRSRPRPRHRPALPYPRATSNVIITMKPRAKVRTPISECSPSDISGISSSTTTYIMAPAAKERR